jgi:hypothetical protein
VPPTRDSDKGVAPCRAAAADASGVGAAALGVAAVFALTAVGAAVGVLAFVEATAAAPLSPPVFSVVPLHPKRLSAAATMSSFASLFLFMTFFESLCV